MKIYQQSIFGLLSLLTGNSIGWLDSSKNWDDTAVTVGLIVLSSGLIGFAAKNKHWLYGILIGVPVLVWNLALGHGWGAAIAMVFALAGVYLGRMLRGMGS